MTSFATLPSAERRLFLEQAAAHLGLMPVAIEKDFWVCWILGQVFANPEVGPHVVFKGGTSLFKVFRAIERFSEDVDLSVAPTSLGFTEQQLDEAPSPSQRTKRMAKLTESCKAAVHDRFQPALEAAITAALGYAPEGASWLTYEVDADADTPNLWFDYPSALTQPGGYIRKRVKLEIGALTRQQPTGEYSVSALMADALGSSPDDFRVRVVALELGRTFWEKATILHAEYHRPLDKPIRDRSSRHYSDFGALWNHPAREQAILRLDILEDVVLHKSRFFPSCWAHYDTARRGTFCLVPPQARQHELRQDYAAMRPMFLNEPQPFEELLGTLAQAEQTLNAT